LNNGETIVAYDIVDESADYLSYNYYFTNPNTGVKMTTLSNIGTLKTQVNYYVIGSDTTYLNFVVDGVVYNKEQMLNKLFLENDPQNYYQNLGFDKIGSAGGKLIGGTLVGVGGGIISSALLLTNSNYKVASGVSIGAGAVSLGLILSAGVDLIKAKRILKNSINQKGQKYQYKGVLLN